MRKWIPALAAVAWLAITTPAQARWGNGNECSLDGEHCYSLTRAHDSAYAAIGYQYTVFATVYCTSEEAFVDQEMWVFPEAVDKHRDWIEDGQTVGDPPDCNQRPYIFFAEVSPDTNTYHEVLSTLPTWSGQYNLFAISDLPEKNGNWHTYYRIPNESSVWSEGPTWGGGWSAKIHEEEAGMEAAAEYEPSYEGKSETAYTNTAISPLYDNWYNWTGAVNEAEYGSTCVASQGTVGDINTATC